MTKLGSFHPAVSAWFERTFEAPTDVQRAGWDAIARGRDTLVSAPTGSGKTLTAFLSSIDSLLNRGQAGEMPEGIDVIYVSPLKALSSDIHRNLEVPLREIAAIGEEMEMQLPEISVGLRTGDTTAAQRAQILRDVPQILVTTPESLYLMLTAERSRVLLRSVRTVIVDELHALMRDKRGSHLALSLARLDAISERRPVRIGLSATIHPIEEAANFLVGVDAAGAPRPCTTINAGHRRELDLGIEIPPTDLAAVASNEQWGEIYDRIAELIKQHRTTLVFVNTRRLSERIAHHLEERLGADVVAAHHGSLSKDRRLHIEERLKAGEMRAIVATASLELGIDVGSVDLVCQIGSPRAITVFLQRIGRAGHGLGRVSKGRLFATTRDELVECAALLRSVRQGTLDRIEPPQAPLDVLAQQLVAECACEKWREDDLFTLVRSATPYAQLARRDFDDIVLMLSEGPASRPGRGRALLHRDAINGTLRGRRAARLTAITCGGAIPDVSDYRVVLDPDETFLGTVNEDWAVESQAGDIFLLGSHSWRIRRVESARGVLRVEDAAGLPPSVPFWLGEAPGRTWELSRATGELRAEVATRDADAARAWLTDECGTTPAGAGQVVEYIAAERSAIGVVPTQDDVVFERFFDESGGMQLVVHAPFGARVNRGLGLALRKRFCVTFDFELQAAATDDAVVLSMGPQHSFPLEDAFSFVRSPMVEATLRQAVLAVPMFTTRWRWNATRALMVLRTSGGARVPFPLQRMRADDLMAAVFPAQVACQENNAGPIEIPDHPLVEQTLHDCLYEAIDLNRLRSVLEKMESGEIRLHARDTTEPSPFAHEILNASPYAFLDDAPLEERRTQAVNLRRILPEHQRDLGALDSDAIERVSAQIVPQPRDAYELHDCLLQLLVMQPRDELQAWFNELTLNRRAAEITTAAGVYWFAAENLPRVRALYPEGTVMPPLELPPHLMVEATFDEACEFAVRGLLEISGPTTADAVATTLGVRALSVRSALARLEGEGLVLSGRFTPGASTGEVCDRRILARIHRQTLDRLRSEIEPVTAQDFMRYLLARHGVGGGARREGKRGLVEAIVQLQGFEIPATAWEREILPQRVAGYQPRWLDELCLEGQIAWARLSVTDRDGSHRVVATRTTPVTLALRSDIPWLLQAARGDAVAQEPERGAAAAVLHALRQEGALFFEDLVHITKRLPTEVENALWELVSRGLIHGDGFGALRQIMRRARRPRGERTSMRGPLAPGRFALLRSYRTELRGEELAEKVALQLLARYGVVFRDVVAREQIAVPWRDIIRALRRMEARGTVRGGRFVSGFIGEQYGLPDAIDGLRRIRRQERDGEQVRLNATDPLNLVGILSPGPRALAVHTKDVTFVDGIAAQPLVSTAGR